MSKLSVAEFKDLISDGAIVYCTNKEDCLKVIDFLQSLGFPLSETIMNFKGTETYLSPGFGEFRKLIARYSNSYINKNLKTKTNTIIHFGKPRTIIRFEEVPFEEVCSQQSDEDFYECFTRFLLS